MFVDQFQSDRSPELRQRRAATAGLKHSNRYLCLFALYLYLFHYYFLQLHGGQLIFYLFFGMLDEL